MPSRRGSRLELELPLMMRHLLAVGESAPSINQKVDLVRSMRERDEASVQMVDDMLVRQIAGLASSLNEAEQIQHQLREKIEQLTEPPLHAALFLAVTNTRRGEGAVVSIGNSRRVVNIDEEVDLSELKPGDEVLLCPQRNIVIDASFDCLPRNGESAMFDRMTPDGRVVIRHRDEEIVATPSGSFDPDDARAGDTVLWDRESHMVFERIENSKGDHLFLDDMPEQSFDDIGGLDDTIEELKRWIWMHRDHAGVARCYGLHRRRGAIMTGPPGNGKTMLARAFARYLGELSPTGRCRFISVKPSEMNSMWHGQSEANCRQTFRCAREAGEADPDIPVVMFFDEIDANGRTRGGSVNQIDDRVMTAFMAELDGLDKSGAENIIVLAATNRPDTLDPALLRPDRLGDDIIVVPRPNRKAAASIFSKYLHDGIPLDGDAGGNGEGPHAAMIDSVLAKLYSSNGEGTLATLTFRDGSQKPLRAADFVSGAVISKIVNEAAERACLRDIETGQSGVRLGDLLSAVDDEFERVLRFLTPRNIGSHIDLPQDTDVVRIQPVERQVRRPHLYLRVS